MSRRKGFTLVELVVVIMILGILAGVAAPKLLNTSGQATDNGLRQTLSVVRDAIELYAAQNGGALPDCTSTGADFRAALEPYLRGAFPVAPVGTNKDEDVTPTTGATTTADNATGWMFNTTNGTFICNSTATGVDGNAYSTY
ncbi:type II secretion system protein [Botrimarina hoheduenensis]|uniref:Type II secretion system protein G n=1 Tax=Botrimarina hoheduenensis TaxID=2528000 RepID=A0A5C5VRE8_9BACT|nr:type II secretion system protein [Botrimarina hoheduenensis]TWT40142.1 Type II secretion system protein G precursor [Botrimarina hoheduenensis]